MLKIVLLVLVSIGCSCAREIVDLQEDNVTVTKNGLVDDLNVTAKYQNEGYCLGYVDPAGNIVKSYQPGCFHVVKTLPGIYQIHFTPAPLPNLPVCTVTQLFPHEYVWASNRNTRANAVIMNADTYKMFYVTGNGDGEEVDRYAMFHCVWLY